MAAFPRYAERPVHQLRADPGAGVTGQGVKLAQFDRVRRVGMRGVVARIAQLAEGDEFALVLDQAMGAAFARNLASDCIRIVHSCEEGFEVFRAVEIAESSNEGLGPQRGKRWSIGEGGRTQDHGRALARAGRVVKLAKPAAPRYTCCP